MSGPNSNTPRTCFITGASRGLGQVLAQQFWVSGWSLILTSRSVQDLEQTVAGFETRADQHVHCLAADLANPDAVEQLIIQAQQRVPNIHALINNAAIQGPIGQASQNDWLAWHQTLQVNLMAPVRLCQHVVTWMERTVTHGSIINLSGGGATGPRPHFSAYATAKAGLVRFSETLAEEVRANHIRVNCVAPGVMNTAMLQSVAQAGASLAGEKEVRVALNAATQAEDTLLRVAELCLFLASPASSGITGKLISAVWDNWATWPHHLDELNRSDAYTLRRIVGKDRQLAWGDK
ncbi:MAG: SDR family oxidoreductase [Pseudomonadota bacterium]